MLSIDEARRRVLEHVAPLAPRPVSVDQAAGLVLAEDVASDVDSPPHDKSIVDGYALRADDFAAGRREYDIVEEVVAGRVPARAVQPGTATRIMTGAPLPAGADAVVMIEQTEPLGEAPAPRVRVNCPAVSPGQNIVRRGTSLRQGEVVLRAPHRLRAIEVGLLCEVGRATVSVIPPPEVAVLATGDELVPACEVPGPGQIRNSNGPMLSALAARCGAKVVDLGIGRDRRDALQTAIQRGLDSDLLVLSGGVSAGVLDLVPGVLAELGVEQVFHKVHLKPGKPLWFGVDRRGASGRLVFGLPGNPVSSLVCFDLFVRPAIEGLMGLDAAAERMFPARLGGQFHQRSDRPTFFPAALEQTGRQWQATPLVWHGSGDLRGLVDADALIYFPPGERLYEAGQVVEVRRL